MCQYLSFCVDSELWCSFRLLKVLRELCYQLIVIPDHIRVLQKYFSAFLISKHDSSGLAVEFPSY